ncbi:hypothetical protein FACS1894110_10760 [Spirochaetia bacterium]|nr:hypothetical protein FACS1894110_10760 [Spirochaetia bacterium]
MEQKTVGIDGTKVLYAKSKDEMDEKEILYEYFRNSPVPEDLMLEQLSLYITRQNLSDILYYDNLYKKILDKHGVICDLGVFYGRPYRMRL